MNRFIIPALCALALAACDKPKEADQSKAFEEVKQATMAEQAKKEQAAKQAKLEAEAQAQAEAQAAAASKPLDVCALLPVADIQRILGVTGDISASPDHLRLIGSNSDHLGHCGYQNNGKNVVTISVMKDDNYFKRIEQMAKMSKDAKTGLHRKVNNVANSAAYMSMDGSLVWLNNGRLVTVNAFKTNSIEPLNDEAMAHALATAIDGNL